MHPLEEIEMHTNIFALPKGCVAYHFGHCCLMQPEVIVPLGENPMHLDGRNTGGRSAECRWRAKEQQVAWRSNMSCIA